jgi:RHH-type proline utilization regulon transcriptional repressor/proline dehydrogenase/delta 1-pyrroline-5-carboxylate dehydrogenase
VPPTLIEVARVADVEREIFGPVLHLLRFPREDLDRVIGDVNTTGYGLTFGLHTRIDETIARVVNRIEVGNVYVNRNMVGAVVGVQPFGGSGMSGTGPKAGGPFYLGRLSGGTVPGLPSGIRPAAASLAPARLYAEWLQEHGRGQEAERVLGYLSRSSVGAEIELPGPVGERNLYMLRPRGRIAALARSERALLVQIGAILATGNVAVIAGDSTASRLLAQLPAGLRASIVSEPDPERVGDLGAVLSDRAGSELIALQTRLADRNGRILSVQSVTEAALAAGQDYELSRLVEEVSISTNTAAAGGNASLMSIG